MEETRGNDLSGSLEGSGGIGGLLARSDGYSSGNFSGHTYYHADGSGNITYLIDGSQVLAASYRYNDPYGYSVTPSGSLAGANVFRFSSKERHAQSAMYYYGFRFYDPNAQRWINRDPLGENGFERIRRAAVEAPSVDPNLYCFVRNDALDFRDPYGLSDY